MRSLLPLLALLIGCTSDPLPPEPTPDPGLDPTVPAAPGEARAAFVRAGQEAALFGGVNAEGRLGDIKLYNARIQLIVQASESRHGMVDVRGHLIDADLVRSDVLARDTLEDAALGFGLARLAEADTVEILSDGSDGGPAIVRSVGRDIPWAYTQGLFELPEPNLPDLGLAIVQELRLAPDSWVVDLATTLTNRGTEPVTLSPRDVILSSGEDLWSWAPGRGLAGPETGDLEAWGVSGKSGEATLSLWSPGSSLSNAGLGALAGDLGINTLTHAELTLAPGASTEVLRRFAVTPDILTAEALRWEEEDVALVNVAGQVQDAAGGVAGVRIWFVAEAAAAGAAEVAGFAMSDEEGRWAARVPPGDWTVYAVARERDEAVALPASAGRYGPFAGEPARDRQLAVLAGTEDAATLPFATGRATPPAWSGTVAEGTTIDFTLAAPSGIRIAIDDGGSPSPAVLDLRRLEGPADAVVPGALLSAFGIEGGSRAAWGWTGDGTLQVPLPPGRYSVRAGHSWRHSQGGLAEVVVEEGQIAEVSISLEEVVPRDGWLSLDSHLHAAPSFDGTLSMEHRLVTCAATGVDLPILTDHDRQVDYSDLNAALGLDARMTVLPGVEVTTVVRGHFNLFPIQPDLAAPNGGAEPWWITPRDTQDLFDRMRERAGPDALTQVNHPRTPGMFSVSQFDPVEAEPRNPAMWSWDFELFELLNGGVVDLPAVRADWFGMLNSGRVKVPMGSSDSHYSYIPCGWGRTDVLLERDTPVGVTSEEVREALRAGRVVVAGGTTLRATLDLGSGPIHPGGTTSGSEGAFTLQVRAPDWIQPGTLRVYRDGVAVYEQELGESTDGVWFDGSVPVHSDGPGWFAVEVEGSEPVAELWRGFTPYAMTNAFFVE